MPIQPPPHPRSPLCRRLAAALAGDGSGLDALAGAEPADRHDAAGALLALHDLHVAPIDSLGAAVRWQHHPAIAALKGRLEELFVADLDRADRAVAWGLPAEPAAALRAVARRCLLPPVYDWVSAAADHDELVEFLALEGGPDGGFDDLVAACQIGLAGGAKLEMARNYWDEMGNGSPADVHTELHHRLVGALGIKPVPRSEQPVEALERAALGTLLATNRRFQPEMVGALGLIELQAAPRCRRVLEGLRRVGAPIGALRFYEVHAEVDPRHGKDWVDHVVDPLSADPAWAEGIVRGARWRSLVNARFFEAMTERFLAGEASERRAS